MILNTSTYDISMTPRPVNETFKIAMNSKMFEVLYSSLYKRPMDAIMRELTSNIYDAHQMNGQTRPGEITLPSVINPTIIFRDYGPGLSDTDCRNLYTTLGASTKEEDADAIGNYGLGSKTPLAYTDALTVNSRHQGVLRVYTIVKGADLIPVLTSDDIAYDSDEPDGLEIIIPTKAGDDLKWQQVARRVLRWFSPDLITVHGLIEPIVPIETVYETEKWMLTSSEAFKSAVLMGPVTYELDWISLENGPQSRVIFKMPMGSVQPQPSREGLTYDPETQRRMEQAIAEFNVEFAEWIENQLVGLSPFDCAVTFRQLKARWAGKPMPLGYSSDLILEEDIGFINCRAQRRNYRAKSFKPAPKKKGDSIQPSNAMAVILNDLPDPARAGVVRRLKNNQEHFGSDINSILIVTDLAHVGNPTKFTRLSDYPLPYVAGRALKGKVTRTKPMVFTLETNWRSTNGLNEELSCEPCDGAVYAPLDNRTILDPKWRDHTVFAETDGKIVWGFTKRAVDYFDDLDTEVLSDFVKRRCKEMVSDKELLLAKARQLNQPGCSMIRYLIAADSLPADCQKVVDEFKKGYSHPDLQLFNRALSLNLIALPKLPKVFPMQPALDKIRARYPVFAHICSLANFPPTDKAQLAVVLSSLKIRS